MAIWLKRLSILAVFGFPLSVLGKRLGLFDFRVGFTGLSWTVYLSLGVLVVGAILMVMHRESNRSSFTNARNAVLISLIPLIGIGSQLVTAASVPSIHNISTDVIDPPKFDKVVALRDLAAKKAALNGEEINPHVYDKRKLALAQQKAYPQIKTFYSALSTEQAYEKALTTVESLGWTLVNDDPGLGIIEATETTALWAFKDDVVIRIQAQDDGKTAIDLRSVSRVGKSDLGANAKRIQRFLDSFAG